MEEPVAPVEEPVAPVEEPVAPVEEPVAPVEEPVVPAEEPVVPAEEPVVPAEEPVVPVEESADSTWKPAAAQKKKRGGMLILLIAIAVIVVAAVVLAVVGLFGGKGGKNVGYVYATDDYELMYLKDLKEKTTAEEISDDDATSVNVAFSADGKYIYFVANEDYESIGKLYRIEAAKIGKDGVEAEKLSSDVRAYSLVCLKNGNLLYQKVRSDERQLYLYDGEQSYKLANEVYSSYGIDEKQTYYYYSEYDEKDGTEALCRVELIPNGESETVIKEFDMLYSDIDDEILLYGVEEDSEGDVAADQYGYYDYNTYYTLYSIKPGEQKEKLAKDVISVSGAEAEDGKLSFYYLTCQIEENTLYDFVSDSQKASDAANPVSEPVYPDWYEDYRPYAGLFVSDDNREYYESASGLIYYIDTVNYPDMDSVDIAYAMADDLYNAALEEYEIASEEWYEYDYRQSMRTWLQEEMYTTVSYTLHRYENGETTDVAARLSDGWLEGVTKENIFFYSKVPEVGGAVIDLSEVESTYDVYDKVYTEQYGNGEDEVVVYVNINGAESEFDSNCGDGSYIMDYYFLGDNELLLSIWDEDEEVLCSYTIANNELTYKDTILDEEFSACRVKDGKLYYFLDLNDEYTEGDLYCYSKGESTRIHTELFELYELENGTQLVFSDYEEGDGDNYSVAELSVLDKDGKRVKISDEVQVNWLWFLTDGKIVYGEDTDLYLWDGKESRRLASNVSGFWTADELDYSCFWIR